MNSEKAIAAARFLRIKKEESILEIQQLVSELKNYGIENAYNKAKASNFARVLEKTIVKIDEEFNVVSAILANYI